MRRYNIAASLRPHCNSVQPRKVYCFNKGDQSSMKEDLHQLHQELKELPSSTNNSLWKLFKRRIACLMDKHIPLKILKGQKIRKQWVGKKAKAAIRKKARLYTRMKGSNNEKDI